MLFNAWDDPSFWSNLKAPSEVPTEPECPNCRKKAAPEHVERDLSRGTYKAKCWWCENRWQG
jgi:hypothetical protein